MAPQCLGGTLGETYRHQMVLRPSVTRYAMASPRKLSDHSHRKPWRISLSRSSKRAPCLSPMQMTRRLPSRKSSWPSIRYCLICDDAETTSSRHAQSAPRIPINSMNSCSISRSSIAPSILSPLRTPSISFQWWRTSSGDISGLKYPAVWP
jgi:hypothetical protein